MPHKNRRVSVSDSNKANDAQTAPPKKDDANPKSKDKNEPSTDEGLDPMDSLAADALSLLSGGKGKETLPESMELIEDTNQKNPPEKA